MQLTSQGVQGRRDYGRVDRHHQQREGDDSEDQPAAGGPTFPVRAQKPVKCADFMRDTHIFPTTRLEIFSPFNSGSQV
jgi:hypothetical protein